MNTPKSFEDTSADSTMAEIKKREADARLPSHIRENKKANILRALIRANITHKTLNN